MCQSFPKHKLIKLLQNEINLNHLFLSLLCIDFDQPLCQLLSPLPQNFRVHRRGFRRRRVGQLHLVDVVLVEVGVAPLMQVIHEVVGHVAVVVQHLLGSTDLWKVKSFLF